MITLHFRREVIEEAIPFTDGIFQAGQAGRLIIERITSPRFTAAWELRKKFQDKSRISFTDLTSMVIMQERGIKRILTEDDHFLHIGMGLQKVP